MGNQTGTSTLRGRASALLCSFAERTFQLDRLNRLYDDIGRLPADTPYCDRILRAMNVRCQVPENDLANIPRTGPVVVVANHPFGGIEGVILASLLRAVRPDAKIMANHLLARAPELSDFFIFVDPFGTDQAVQSNRRPMKDCLRLLRAGGMLGIFPSGEVSHLDVHRRRFSDPDWNPHLARLILRSGATVVPIYFNGLNGPLFHLAGLMHPRLRTAMLPREFLNKQNTCVNARIGQPVSPSRLREFERDVDVMDYLRLRTYTLALRSAPPHRTLLPARRAERFPEPLVPPSDPNTMAAEINALPSEHRLLTAGDLHVYYAESSRIPAILHEIGRLRELTFRQAHEGTGQPIDLDAFDEHYLHLFIWNPHKRELAGAYRIGQTDVLLPRFGIRGLYSSTLFKYRKELLQQLDPALEMGRSFICPEYQRNYSALLLLWKGMGAYIARHPRYVNLFGPVSINNEYQSTSRRLLVRFLRSNNYDAAFARLIRPRTPMTERRIRHHDDAAFQKTVRSIDDVSSLIRDIETDQKGVPILLKQYLKLGGKLLAFNIDPDFSDVLDGLIWVDLRKTDQRSMTKYMGREAYDQFRQYHHLTRPPTPHKMPEGVKITGATSRDALGKLSGIG
ncbi:MAG: GNAT family N-acetyltransferase [Kiritimatiellae bacterium]|nr:GNAT family N-acetyltransferase [Kiritimatiellia bacterium]